MRGSGKRIAVVVPAHNEETQIAKVIETMPDWVDHIVVVDDVSTDKTCEVVEGLSTERVELVRHESNKGVGAAITTGYYRALEAGADAIAVMAGDGQMPPDELAGLVDPVISGVCDYSKANRLSSGEAWKLIPHKRYLGNAALTFLTKIASGYYRTTDSQTGYTVISAKMLKRIDLDSMYPRYGYPNDILVRLNVEDARVLDVPSHPVYDVGEKSGLKIQKVLFTISWLLFKRFWWRMAVKHVVRDFHPLILFYVLGLLLLTFGLVAGACLIAAYAIGRHPAGATAVLVSLAVNSGLTLTMFGMLFDFENNRRLSVDYRDAKKESNSEAVPE